MTLKMPSTRTMAIAAGSVTVAGIGISVYKLLTEEREVISAKILSDPPYRIQRLYELRNDEEAMKTIQEGLVKEWGPFAPADIGEMRQMARNAGKMVYVLRPEDNGTLGEPIGALQTGIADVDGDPDRLAEKYKSFNDIISNGTWKESRRMKGNTVLLLQITAFGERGQGKGSMLRNAALYMLPDYILYGLTMTPYAGELDSSDPNKYPERAKFHFRGGAELAGHLENYKLADPSRPSYGKGNQQDPHIVFMRYRRNREGEWERVRKPEIELEFSNPFYTQLLSAFHRFQTSHPETVRTPTYLS